MFGHNAPFKGLIDNPRHERRLDVRAVRAVGQHVDLDGSHPDVIVGSWVVLSKPTYRELFKVTTVTELSRADYAVSGNVTRLELSLGENYTEQFAGAVRETTVFAVQEALDFAEAPDETDVEGDEIRVDADVSGMRPGRRLIVRGTTTSGGEAVEDAVLEECGERRISLDSDLAHVFMRNTVVVHGNVAIGDARRDRAATPRLGTRGARRSSASRSRTIRSRTSSRPTRRAHEPHSRCA